MKEPGIFLSGEKYLTSAKHSKRNKQTRNKMFWWHKLKVWKAYCVVFEMPWCSTAPHMLVIRKTTYICPNPLFHAISSHKEATAGRKSTASDSTPPSCDASNKTLNLISSAPRQNFNNLIKSKDLHKEFHNPIH